MKSPFSRLFVFLFSRFLILSSAASFFITQTHAQVVDIPDPNLEQAIREALRLPNHTPIVKKDMEELVLLPGEVAWRRGITDLTGLEYATNLEGLSLRFNQISDLTPITNLINLRTVMLNENPITDLTPLSGLINLRRLGLTGCMHITDISPLKNLVNLRYLFIQNTLINDFTPIQHLNLIEFEHDQVCDIPPQLPSARERIESRSFPSIFQAWAPILGLDHLTWEQRRALHDLHWSSGLATDWDTTVTEPYEGLATSLTIDLADSQDIRRRLLAQNPNMIFIRGMSIVTAHDYQLPLDSSLWLRDLSGEIVRTPDGTPVVNFLKPEVQDLLVRRIIAYDRCGVLDGVFFDNIGDQGLKWRRYYPPETTDEDIIQALLNIFRNARKHVRDDFLIIINTNAAKPTHFAEHLNGIFMETGKDYPGGYSLPWLIEVEDSLDWAEKHLREPRVNCLEGEGISIEPPDSTNNLRWMRLFTTMSLTHSDGYVIYTDGRRGLEGSGDHDHIWYDFWDADLGRPVGPKAQHHQNTDGLFIREFTNGWAVYNRSGTSQQITLPIPTTPVSDRGNNAASQTHLLPDLDGEIYLKAKNPADVNGDWEVNVLDLVQVANGLGQSTPDPNGDGVVNILDLVFVAQQFSE